MHRSTCTMAAAHVFHFLVLQHGYRSTASDFDVLASMVQSALPPAPYIVLRPRVNEHGKTDDGVLKCGERLSDYIVTAIEGAVQDTLQAGPSGMDSHAATEDGGANPRPVRWPAALHAEEPAAATPDLGRPPSPSPPLAKNERDGRPNVVLHLNFVCHSMGGLMTRAALPSLATRLSAKYPCVCYDTFCTISTPHVGCRQMPSNLRRGLGDWTGRLTGSKGLKDMFLRTEVLTSLLLQDVYLQAWHRFTRRVLMGVVNDNTVMAYSCVFMVPPSDVTLFEGRSDATRSRVGSGRRRSSTTPAASAGSHEPESNSRMPTPTYTAQGLFAQLRQQVQQPSPSDSAGESLSLSTAAPYLQAAPLPPLLWPPHLLAKERAMAERIVSMAGPFEVYLVDFRPLVDASLQTAAGAAGVPVAETGARSASNTTTTTTTTHKDAHNSAREDPSTPIPVPAGPVRVVAGASAGGDPRYGAFTMPHRAIICKTPCNLPHYFGFVSAFVAQSLLGVSVQQPTTTTAEENPEEAEEAMHWRSPRVVAGDTG